MMALLVDFLLLVGAAFVLLAAIGVLRMPDLYTRMQASTKAGTLGVGCLLMAVVVHFDDLGVTTRAILVIGFLFMTAPVAAHMIGQAAYHVGVPQWRWTVIDELRPYYTDRAQREAEQRESGAETDPAAEPPGELG